jgi:hypothetical protein
VKPLRLANDEVELEVATAYGPRITRYARVGGRNVFGEISPAMQAKDTPYGDSWHIYGGHRLWYAPEADPRSYYPDNRPVRVDADGRRVKLTQDVEEHTRLEKSIEVELAESGSTVSLVHRITNRGALDVELAPWALSVMATGGRAIFRHADFVPHPVALAPARPLVLWAFTRMDDPRWTWGDRVFSLRQDPTRDTAQKIGFYDDHGWMAYELGRLLFVKRHFPAPGTHADFGCNVETFTNEAILELETLGPLARIAPDAAIEHREEWSLFDGVDLGRTEQETVRVLASLGCS